MSILDAVNRQMVIKYKRAFWSYESYANGLLRIWGQIGDRVSIKGEFGLFCFECDRSF